MALRLTLGGDRSARVRLLLMTGGAAVAVALLLGVAGAAPAALERLDRVDGRYLTYDQKDTSRTQGVRARTSVGYWRGTELRVLDVEVVGPPVTSPPGLSVLPGPGEVLVSPALAEALAGEHGAELAPRLHGTVVGRIGPAGLVGPDELFAVAGAPPGVLSDALAAGFGAPRPVQPEFSTGDAGNGVVTVTGGVSDELKAASAVAAVGLVVPLLVLVSTATRLSAATRDRRSAALRLVGATGRQVRTLGAVEGLVVGGIGAAAGVALFLLLRAPVASIIPVPSGLFATDVRPPAVAVLAVLVGVPLLTTGTGVLAVRKAVTSPLGVRRQATTTPASPLRLLPLAAGLLMLVGALADRDAVLGGRWHGTVLLLGGAALCLIGIAVAGPALAGVGGTLLARFGRGPASQLAGRRLALDPGAAARTVTGTALVVVCVAWLLAFLPLLATSSPNGRGDLAAVLQPATVVMGSTVDSDFTPVLPAVDGVAGSDAVVPARELQLLRPGAVAPADVDIGKDVDYSQFPIQAVVVDCAELSQVLRQPLTDCRPDTVYRLVGPSIFDNAEITGGSYDLIDRSTGERTGQQVALPADIPVLAWPDGLVQGIDGFGLAGSLLLPPSMVPASAPDSLLIATNGRDATVEAVRAALGPVRTPFPPLTAEEAVLVARSATDGYARAALLGLVLVVLVGGLSLAVTTADGLRERRRAHAALTAMGTPLRVLRRSVLLQNALPLLLSTSLALVVAAAASWLYLRLGASPEVPAPPLPWAGYAAVGGSAVLASLLATAASLPFVRAAARPDALRAE